MTPTRPPEILTSPPFPQASKWGIRFSVFSSALLCLLATLVNLSQIADDAGAITEAPAVAIELVLPLFIILTGVILIALSLRVWTSVWKVLGLATLGVLGAMPTVLAVLSLRLSLSIWVFVAALVFWVLVGTIWVASASESVWSGVLLSIGVAWSMIYMICEIGLWSPVRFAVAPLEKAKSLSLILDLRITSGVLFVAFALLTAVVRAFLRRFPTVPKVPTPQVGLVDGSHEVLAPLLNPPLVVMNGLIFVAVAIVNTVLGIAVTILLFLLFTGWELGRLLWRLLAHKNAVLRMGKALLACFVTFALAIIALEASPALRAYLRTTDTYRVGGLIPVLALCVLVVVCGTLITLTLEGRRVVPQRALFGASVLAVILLLAGGLTYGIVATHILSTSGFTLPGPISAAGALLIFCGVFAITATNVSQWRRRGASEDEGTWPGA